MNPETSSALTGAPPAFLLKELTVRLREKTEHALQLNCSSNSTVLVIALKEAITPSCRVSRPLGRAAGLGAGLLEARRPRTSPRLDAPAAC
jgi:hypothetical protein